MIEEISKLIFSLFCHQNESLLIKISGQFIPICPRCIGLHCGFFLTGIFFGLYKKSTLIKHSSYPILMILIFTTMFHWIMCQFGMTENSEFPRILTGSISGSAFYMFFITFKNEYAGRNKEIDSYYFGLREIFILSFVTLSIFGILLSKSWLIITLFTLSAVMSNFIQLIAFLIQFISAKIFLLFLKRRLS